MTVRRIYEMTQEELKYLMTACSSVPLIALQCGAPASPQERANLVWEAIGHRCNCDGSTARPVEGQGPRFFSALPLPTQEPLQ